MKIDELEPSVLDTRARLRVSTLENTFENFNIQKGTEQAYDAFYGIATGRAPQPMCLCYGSNGSGKTHLLEASVIEFNQRGVVCRYYAFYELTDILKGSMRRPNEAPGYDEILGRWCLSPNPIVLDDIGTAAAKEKLSEFEAGLLEEITDARYRRGLVTLMATNLDPKDDFPSRVYSRFRDRERAILVLNDGKDYRKLKTGVANAPNKRN